MEFGKEYFDFCMNHNNFDMNDINGWHDQYFNFLKNVFGEAIKGISLDVGCATGNYLELFRRKGLTMFGCDVSKWYIEKSPFPKVIRDRMGVIIDDKIPFKDNQFGFVHMCQVIEHIPEKHIIPELMEVKRVMNDGALFYISTVGEGPAIPAEGEDPTHISCFSREKWNGIFEQVGFKNLSEEFESKIKSDKFAGGYDWVNFVLTKD